MKKNLVIVGYGGMGQWHEEFAQKSDVVNLLGVYDIDEKKNNIARGKGIFVYQTFEDILNDPRVDLITCATPNDAHHDIVIKSLEAGKNVISEKPVTMSSELLRDMIDAAKKSNKIFTVHQNRRWDEDFLSFKRAYESGALGEVFNVESRVQGSHGIPGDWRAKKEFGGGMMLDWGVHLIDQVLQMIPEKISTIYARMDHITNAEVDDGFKLEIIFESGKRAFIEVGTRAFVSLPRWYMQGENGTAILENWRVEDGNMVCCEDWDEKEVVPVKTAAGLTKTMAPRDSATISENRLPSCPSDVHDFYRNVCKAIDGEEEQLITHEQMMRVMKVMEYAFKSDSCGQVIGFDE